MEEPLIIKIDECRKQITDAIKNSKLTPSIASLILRDILNETEKQKVKEYQIANQNMKKKEVKAKNGD